MEDSKGDIIHNNDAKESTKEDSDRAWWSDYQASTKLKRKWTNNDKCDFDDFDDILGDLDDIVKKSDSDKPISSNATKGTENVFFLISLLSNNEFEFDDDCGTTAGFTSFLTTFLFFL